MKKRIIPAFLTLGLVAVVGFGSSQVLNKKSSEQPDPRVKASENATKVSAYKEKSRENLKPFRYDASNVTHFNYLGYGQKKEIEVLMFNGNDYRLVFNAEGAPKPVDIEFWDKPATNQSRVKIHEFKNVTGQENLTVESSVLNTKFRDIKGNPDLILKRVYVDYIISTNDSKEPLSGFMVLTYGYKNI